MVPAMEESSLRRLLRIGAIRRPGRARPRDPGEVLAMARMARARWQAALASGEIEITDEGYRWRPGWDA